ncbi:class I SAM-dependent methyltransferase [Noviherbaspirillum sedimenti]|uniref:Class I SAM-dependent methyltransferase n=2 Tax=Noviherbaspirillum sedimenti TaxID=2320865 RepID=A0A3A3G6Q0_9BURK|nr:class I SAM-dependent methyltransferase [Noviherbaspirillum sedimenti]
MQDAANAHPVCGDNFAHLFMSEYGVGIYELFREEQNANASILVRHRIIDELLREQLQKCPESCIVTIGAGFDSRPYRLAGGNWFELDEPPVVSWKNERLPARECHNPLQRIAIDFASETLEDKLAAIAPAGPVILVVEGVFIYLSEAEIQDFLAAFQQRFPNHQIICDLVSRDMVANYGRSLHAKIQSLGTRFQAVARPETVFTLNGYCIREGISIIERAVDFGVNKIPKLLLNYFFSGEVMGNAVYVFEPADPYGDLVI